MSDTRLFSNFSELKKLVKTLHFLGMEKNTDGTYFQKGTYRLRNGEYSRPDYKINLKDGTLEKITYYYKGTITLDVDREITEEELEDMVFHNAIMKLF